MKIKFSEKNTVVILFILVLITFSVAQEQSRVMERVYTGKWNLQAVNSGTPAKSTPAQMAGPVKQAPVKSN